MRDRISLGLRVAGFAIALLASFYIEPFPWVTLGLLIVFGIGSVDLVSGYRRWLRMRRDCGRANSHIG